MDIKSKSWGELFSSKCHKNCKIIIILLALVEEVLHTGVMLLKGISVHLCFLCNDIWRSCRSLTFLGLLLILGLMMSLKYCTYDISQKRMTSFLVVHCWKLFSTKHKQCGRRRVKSSGFRSKRIATFPYFTWNYVCFTNCQFG